MCSPHIPPRPPPPVPSPRGVPLAGTGLAVIATLQDVTFRPGAWRWVGRGRQCVSEKKKKKRAGRSWRSSHLAPPRENAEFPDSPLSLGSLCSGSPFFFPRAQTLLCLGISGLLQRLAWGCPLEFWMPLAASRVLWGPARGAGIRWTMRPQGRPRLRGRGLQLREGRGGGGETQGTDLGPH
jgi:hypothetical protein